MNNIDCYYLIKNNNSNYKDPIIHLYFSRILLKALSNTPDYIKIYDGANKSAAVLATVTGRLHEVNDIYSTSDTILLYFHTAENKDFSEGFDVHIEFINNPIHNKEITINYCADPSTPILLDSYNTELDYGLHTITSITIYYLYAIGWLIHNTMNKS